MGKLKIVDLTINKSLVEYAEGLLDRAKKGDVIAITAVEEYPDGTYNTCGSSVSSRTQTAGMLLDAAINRLSR